MNSLQMSQMSELRTRAETSGDPAGQPAGGLGSAAPRRHWGRAHLRDGSEQRHGQI